MRLTQWFYNEVPARKGVYQRLFRSIQDITYSYWDGKRWYLTSKSPTKAAENKKASSFQNIPWRGLCR